MSLGTACLNGDSYELRGYPYFDENGDLVLPLVNGQDLILDGSWYPTAISFHGLDAYSGDSVTLVGNNKVWEGCGI